MISRQMLDEMEERLKSLGQHYKTLELHRDNLLSDLKRLAGETLDRAERAKSISREFDPDQHLAVAKRESKKALFPNAEIEKEIKSALPPIQPTPEPVKVAVAATTEQNRVQKSFFDDIQ
jgi:vacuolar-type H+-ATPase subunit D/Vma8